MRRLLALALLALAPVVFTGACGRDGPEELRLDGSARIPDDEGVATALTHSSITLDDERTYDVSPSLRAFSSATLELEPMLGRRGQYVQIGLDGDTMVWMAGVARVIDVDGQRSAYHSGTVGGVEDGRLVFEDGTTLALSRGVDAPKAGARVTVRIDVADHRIDEIQ